MLVALAAVLLAGVGATSVVLVSEEEALDAVVPVMPATTPLPAGPGLAPIPGSGGASDGPVPVLLVPGWLDTGRDLAALRIHLLGVGWPAPRVESVTFQEPAGSNRVHAVELAAAVDSLLKRTGASQIDIIAHSMGGLATRWYLMAEDAPRVRRVVFIAAPHRGTLSAHLSWGGGREEMLPDSPFLDTLNTRAEVPAGVEAMTIRTSVDTHIVPGESATLPGVTDHLLCCPTHAGLLRDEEVFDLVREFLEEPVSAR